jgi:hypothetical protein
MRRTTLSTSPTAEIIDHGQMPQLGIGFQVLEHLIPIHLGHLNVEQHQVELSRPQQFQRLATIITAPSTRDCGQGSERTLNEGSSEFGQERPLVRR